MVKVLFAGSPEAAAHLLTFLLESSVEVVGVLTNPDTAKGRHKELVPTAVGLVAQKNSIPVFKPEHLDANCRNEIANLNADFLVCFAYGHIFGPKFLSMFKYGGINLHPSLLPKYRGCTPVQNAILNCDSETAFTIQTLSVGMDEGNILAQEKVALTGKETTETLLNDCAASGAKLISEIIKKIEETGRVESGKPQEGEPSYTGIISKEDGLINWAESAKKIDAKIRAFTPDPGCYTNESIGRLRILEACVVEDEQSVLNTLQGNAKTFENGEVIAFVKAIGIIVKTGNGLLAVKKLQRQQKNAVDYKSFMNGARDFVGTILK